MTHPTSAKLPLGPIGCLVIRGQRSVAIEAAGIHAGPTPTQGVTVAPLAALVAIVDGIPRRKPPGTIWDLGDRRGRF